jgi:hypothetical protein
MMPGLSQIVKWLMAISAALFALVVGQYVYEYFYGKFWKLPVK